MDELTGVQALERKHPDLPMQPGHVLRREFEYVRHGTLTWFINFDVASWQVIEPSWGPTRTEEDCLAHLKCLVESDSTASKWHLMMDNPNTHQSEALVRWIAEREGIDEDILGVKGKRGILQVDGKPRSVSARLDPSDRVLLHTETCFLDEPGGDLVKYFDTQVAQAREFSLPGRIWRTQILAFMTYYNTTMANPIKWTYTGLA